MHFIAILIIALKCLQIYTYNNNNNKQNPLRICQYWKQISIHMGTHQGLLFSSRYQIGAGHRAAACVSRSFISHPRCKELKANCTAGDVPSFSKPFLWAAHVTQALGVKLSLPPVVVSPGDRFTERDILLTAHVYGGYRNTLHDISHWFHDTRFLRFDQQW